jgi:serine protease Do
MRFLLVLLLLVSYPTLADHYENINNKYETISSSIVLISSTRETDQDKRNPLEKFVGPPGEGQPPSREGYGMGTGFFISDTHIVTNYHVIKDSTELTIYAYGWPFEIKDVKIIGYSEVVDIAVLEISADTIFPRDKLEWKKDKAKVGEKVYGLGHGLGQFWSLTEGIISSTYRPGFVTTFVHYYQTDAVINQGNSGGPLLDNEGHVIGVNTMIWSPTSYYIGYGYAVPNILARIVAEQIIETGEFKIPSIGIKMGVTEDKELYALVKELGFDSVLEVQGVSAGSSADNFGLLNGDLIVEVDNEPVLFTPDIIEILWHKSPGDDLLIKLIRNGEIKTIDLILGEAE